MSQITAKVVRDFLVEQYAGQFRALGLEPADVPDSFDLLLGGVIDSLGVLEVVAALENQFGCTLDMQAMDPEKITIIGPLAEYVAGNLAARGSK